MTYLKNVFHFSIIAALLLMQFAVPMPKQSNVALAAQGCALNSFYGTVTYNGVATDGATVTLTDVTSGVPALTALTSGGGLYQIESGNLATCPVAGDQINLTASFSGASVSTTVTYAAQAMTLANLAISSVPVLTTINVTPASASIVAGVTQQFTASALDQFGAAMNPQPTFSWTSSNTAIATINASGLATGVSAGGPVTITATSGAISGTASLTVTAVASVLTDVIVAPATATVGVGATQQLTASPVDQDSLPVAGVTITWSSDNAAVATVNPASGLVSGVGAGTATITASANKGAITVTGSSSITVTAAPVLTTINVSPVSASIVAGNTQQFSASALDQYGAAMNPQPTFSWTSSNTAIATINASGLATGVSAGGPVTITATSGAISGTASLSVTAATFTITSSAGANGTIAPLGSTVVSSGASQVFTITPSAGYDVADVLVDGVSVGAVTTYTFNNVLAGHTISASFVVIPVLTTINVSPASASIVAGTTQQFTASALDQFGAAMNPQPTFTWASADTAIATVNQSGLATGVSAGGLVTLTATSGAISGTTNLTVTAVPVLTSVTVSPVSATIITGATQQFSAAPLDQFSASFIGATVTWSSGNTAVATIDATTGLATGVGVGTSTIIVTATSGATSVSASVLITVNAAPVLTSISIIPASATIYSGATQQFTASALDQFGAAMNPQPTFSWTSSDMAVATIDIAGLASAVGVGSTTITATSGLISGTASLVINASPVLTTISLTPTSTSMIIGSTQQFNVATLDQYGSPIIAAVVWSSASSTIATIDAAGLVTGVGVGLTDITATSGAISATASVSVTPVPVLTTINLTPTSTSIFTGATQQFNAVTLDQFGNPITAAITWATGSSTIASVDVNGLATGLAVGNTTVTVTSGATSASANLAVTPAPVLTSISVTPTSTSIVIGMTRQFTAVAQDQFGNSLVPQPAITWASSSTTSATIGATGLVTGVAAENNVIITATSGAVSGTATVNVLNLTLTNISVSPARAVVKVGDSLQMRAVALDQNGTPLNPQPAFAWASSDGAIASISGTGLVAGLSVGTTTISAINGNIIGTTTLTVSTSTRMDISDDCAELEHQGGLEPEIGDDYSDTSGLTTTHDIYLKVHSPEGESEIELPDGVRISREDGNRFDGRSLTAVVTPSGNIAGLGDMTINGALQWGLSSQTLVFSQPITLRIFVGNSLNGQTLTVRRSPNSSAGWTDDGIVAPATCLVANGLCTFQATKASYYAAASPAPVPVPPSPGGGGGGNISLGNNSSITQIGLNSPLAIAPIAQPQGRVLGEEIFAEGALIRDRYGIDVYIVKYVGAKKFKRLILSPSVFNSYQHLNWNDVLNVDQSVIDSFTTSDLVRAVNDAKVYKLAPAGDTGTKRWIQTAEAFNRLSLDWDAIYEINDVDRNSYTTGAAIE